MRRSAFLAWWMLAVSSPAVGAQHAAGAGLAARDSTRATTGVVDRRDMDRPPLLSTLDLVTLGVGLAGSLALMGADERIANRLQEDRYQNDPTYHDIVDVAEPINEKSLFAAALVGWGIARLTGSRTATDILWHTTESIFVASATATVFRGILGRSRPFVTERADAYDYRPGKGFAELRYRAYPSIHAAAAFATAGALTAETARRSRGAAWVVGPLTYSLAALPGLARMYGDKHWASDVAMGAALGAAASWATVRYHHHRPGNRLDRIFIGAAPVAASGGGVGLTVRAAF